MILVRANFKSILLSFVHKPQSSIFAPFWTPAFAGVTLLNVLKFARWNIFFNTLSRYRENV